ncbi:MAG TPA: hypothetical protein VOB72_19570 [Candidatus Dormibacteraeota bacterium]|nr:hypothetical protein [Candidatus Dormibacteraeota bacterium]
MRRTTKLLAGMLGVVLLAACGASGRPQADQDRDGKLLAGALRSAYADGSSFKLDQQLLVTGGDIPSGQALQLHAIVSDGVLRDGSAKFSYRIEQGQQRVDYDMLVVDGRLYVKQHSASAWKTTSVGEVTTLFPALRIDLVRESVLLATSVSSGALSRIDEGFARKYAVKPAADQLEQLQSMPVGGTSAEQPFLRTASAELDVYLLFPSDKLGRIDVLLSGIDPSNGEKQQIQSRLDLRSAKVGAIQAPADAQQVAAGDILS